MQIVGDLEPDRNRERLALALRVRDLNCAATGAFRNTRNQAITAGERERRFGFSKTDYRARARPRGEAAAIHNNFAARNGGGGGDALYPRNAVLFCRGAEAEFHNRSTILQQVPGFRSRYPLFRR